MNAFIQAQRPHNIRTLDIDRFKTTVSELLDKAPKEIVFTEYLGGMIEMLDDMRSTLNPRWGMLKVFTSSAVAVFSRYGYKHCKLLIDLCKEFAALNDEAIMLLHLSESHV